MLCRFTFVPSRSLSALTPLISLLILLALSVCFCFSTLLQVKHPVTIQLYFRMCRECRSAPTIPRILRRPSPRGKYANTNDAG